MENKTLKVSLRIIALFTATILISKIPDLYPNFFGDWKCNGKRFNGLIGSWEGCDMFNKHNPTWHWGYQHYLFFLMGFSLTIVQIVGIINLINKPK